MRWLPSVVRKTRRPYPTIIFAKITLSFGLIPPPASGRQTVAKEQRENSGEHPHPEHEFKPGQSGATLPLGGRDRGALFLRYADQERLPLPSGLRAYLMGDTRPVVPVAEGRCQRGHCRGSVLAVSEGDDPRCLLCGRTAEAARRHEEPDKEPALAHYG